MSIIIICFDGAPKVTPEALQHEAELEQLIEQKVAGNLTNSFDVKRFYTI